MEKWFGLLIQESIHKMNNPIVKLDLDSIIKNKIYLFFILVCCVQSYLLPFSYHLQLRFSLPLIKITTGTDRLQMQRNWQRLRISKSTNHHTYTDLSLTIVFSESSGLLHWLLAENGVHITVCLGLNFRTHLHSTLRKKTKKQNSEVDLSKEYFFKKQ